MTLRHAPPTVLFRLENMTAAVYLRRPETPILTPRDHLVSTVDKRVFNEEGEPSDH